MYIAQTQVLGAPFWLGVDCIDFVPMLCIATFAPNANLIADTNPPPNLQAFMAYLLGALQAYEHGTPLPAVPVYQVSTTFAKKVYHATCAIDFGDTKSYAQIARDCDNAHAYRAVGGALGRNRVALFVPCHRVIGTYGIGGFAFGTALKKHLLAHEQLYRSAS